MKHVPIDRLMGARPMKPDGVPTAPAPESRARWYVLGLLLLIYSVNFMDRQLFAVVQERIRLDIGLADWQLGLLGGTMFALFYATLGLPLAWVADRANRVQLIALSCTVWSGFTALTGFSSTFLHLALTRIGVASGEAGGVAPSYSVLSDFFEKHQRGLVMGLFSVGAPLGLMAGTLLGALLTDALSWRWAFFILALPGLVLAAILYLTVREPLRGRLDGVPAGPQTEAGMIAALRHVSREKSLALFTAGAACTSFAGYGLYQWVPTFLQRTQAMDLEQVGLFLAPVFIFGMAGSVLGGWVADKLAPHVRGAYGLVPGIAQLIAAPLFVAALMAPSGTATLLLIVAPTLLAYVWIGPTLAAAQNLSHASIRASVAAIIAFFNNLIGFGLGPLAVGAVSSWFTPALGEAEALRWALIWAIAIYVLGAVLFLAAGRSEPDRTDDADAAAPMQPAAPSLP